MGPEEIQKCIRDEDGRKLMVLNTQTISDHHRYINLDNLFSI
jgi:hypothetical protein